MSYIRYENAVKVFYQSLDDFITKYKEEEHTIVMFGTSAIAGMITAYLDDHGMKMDFIIDNAKAKHGKKAYGLCIYPPNKMKEEFDPNALILIASGFQDEMIKQLEEMGYQKDKQIIQIIDLPSLMKDYSFANREGMTLVSNDEIKQEMLRVLMKLKEVCEEHKLKYYLFGGTLLGAVRHKGFIPWDDDIDIIMEINDMKKLSKILKEDKEFSMVCSFDPEDDYYNELAVMFSNRYVADCNHFPMQYTAGVSIDIFPLFGVPDEMDEINAFLEGYKELDMERWHCLYDKKKCQQKSEEIFRYLTQYDFYDSSYVASSSNHYTKTIVPQQFYLNSRMYEFEGIQLQGPDNYDYILSRTYGDYMTLPPVEKRVGWHNFHVYK